MVLFIGGYGMENSLFRVLDASEASEFIQWARDNFVPGMEINPVWHPVVRAELARLESERFVD
jgi:hypothetical protein